VPGFGVLVVIFLFGFALLGFGSGSSSESSTTTFGTGFNLTNGPQSITPVGSSSLVPGPVVGEPDNGSTITLKRADEGLLALAHRRGVPRVAGDAVRLEGIPRRGDARLDEWWIVPVRAGTATITATGGPGAKPFRLTVLVR
jgi:hypothetical protein